MKNLKLLVLAIVFALAFSLASCDLINEFLPQAPDNSDQLLDFGDWENWVC